MNDTITLNHQLIEQWKADGYDYNEDFATNARERSKSHSTSYHDNIDDVVDDFSVARGVLSLIAIVVFLGLIGYFFYKRLRFLDAQGRVEIPEEDTIYGIEFEDNIEEMERQKNYLQCIRLKYLQLLRNLHDKKRIAWMISKTPTQYLYEVNMAEFERITNIFMMIRYGNYPATAELYSEACSLYDVILRGKEVKDEE